MPTSKIVKLIGVSVVYLAIILGGGLAGDWISRFFQFEIFPHNEPLLNRIIVVALLSYMLLTAIPFVPGVEIGLALIMTFGPPIVPIIYLATNVALALSFVVGRLVPERWIEIVFRRVGLERAADSVARLASVPGEDRIEHLMSAAPKRWLPFLLRHRFWAMALLLNLPGSAIIGGGGGIAMAAGMSRLVTLPQFLITTAIAVSPVPVAILVAAALGR